MLLWCSEFVMELVIEIVASMVSAGELGLWADVVGSFKKALWWLQECCSIGGLSTMKV